MDEKTAVEKLKEMLRLNTTNPPGNELRMAEKLERLFSAYGIETKRVPHSEGRVNVIATLKGNGKSSKVLGLSGHMDVVPPGERPWEYDPFSAHEVDGRIYARGACDMKSGLMACVVAMIELKESGVELDGDVKLLATVGEEAGAVGAKQLTEKGYTDDLSALMIAEPTHSEIMVSHKGAFWVEITCYGQTAHGSRPEKGVNALLHMNKVINRLESDDFQMAYKNDRLLGEPTFSINAIGAGGNTNVVPDACSLKIDIRTVPSQRHENILEQLQTLLSNLKEEIPDFSADIRVLNDLAPLKTAEEDSFVQFLLKTYEDETGERKEVGGMKGYTDASQFMKSKEAFPIVIWSPINGKTAHQPNEYVEIADYLEGVRLYRRFAERYLNGE